MDAELESMLDRADELLKDLEGEYNRSLHMKNVTERAKNITHEVLEKSRHALDHTMWMAWGKYIAPNLPEQDREGVLVYFPISSDLHSFRSILGQANKGNVDKVHKELYSFLLNKQPFSSNQNQWLNMLAKIVPLGKHVKFIPQKRTEKIGRVSVSRSGGKVSWSPPHVKFGKGVSIMGVPIDPATQRIIPTLGVNEQVETRVSFVFNNYGIDALRFCKEACEKTRKLIEETVSVLKL